ncbi:hypothetical protein JHV666_48800 [Mycobacterium avium subsp. hominissuis]
MWLAMRVAAITGVYSVALLGYVIVDAFYGEVTATRIASHMPLLLGLAFALLVAVTSPSKASTMT